MDDLRSMNYSCATWSIFGLCIRVVDVVGWRCRLPNGGRGVNTTASPVDASVTAEVSIALKYHSQVITIKLFEDFVTSVSYLVVRRERHFFGRFTKTSIVLG